MILVMALALVAIYSGGSVSSPQEARSYQDRGLLAVLAGEPPLNFSLLLSLPYYRCCLVVVVAPVVASPCHWELQRHGSCHSTATVLARNRWELFLFTTDNDGVVHRLV